MAIENGRKFNRVGLHDVFKATFDYGGQNPDSLLLEVIGFKVKKSVEEIVGPDVDPIAYYESRTTSNKKRTMVYLYAVMRVAGSTPTYEFPVNAIKQGFFEINPGFKHKLEFEAQLPGKIEPTRSSNGYHK